MIKIKKMLSLISLPLISGVAISCANYTSSNKLEAYIDNSTQINPKVENLQQVNHKKIIETLLNNVYKPESQRERSLYVYNQEQDTSSIIQKFKEITTSYKQEFRSDELNDSLAEKSRLQDLLVYFSGDERTEAENKITELTAKINEIKEHNTPAKKEKFANSFSDFISENWYFILNNLDKFNFTFVSWLLDPIGNGYTLSDEYQQSLKTKSEYKNYNVPNTYIDDIKLGDESGEMSDARVYYLKKNKLVFRITINNILQPVSNLKLEPLNWYFGDLKNNKISLNLISNIVHSRFIHGYETGLVQFEKSMVKDLSYGEPANVFFLWKGTNEN
ncbi:aromatic motif membrane protein [Mycoplasma sp. 2704]|uniref:aromatic motif membrane protein n=1 Tax=Mycoplasma sp. 2704 TaxID=3108529 RepID=UPI002B1DDD92|nr:aromatic motif membrane protein [Mycoplasma sp. 2704]MEA4134444.1 aromatic motif membrane protein [Mycoplasma sp. 2704]